MSQIPAPNRTAAERVRSAFKYLEHASTLDQRVVWSTTIFALLAYLVASPGISWASPIRNLAAVAAGQVTMFVLLALFEFAAGRRMRGGARVWSMISAFVLVTAVRGSVIWYVEQSLGVQAGPTLAYRIVGSVTVMSSVLAAATIASASLSAHAQRVNELLTQRERLLQTRDGMSQLIDEHTGELISGIQTQLLEELQQLNRDAPHAAIETLRHAAHDVVRPLSHALATEHVEFEPPVVPERMRTFDWRQAARDAAGPGTVSALGLALILTYMASNLALHHFGAELGARILVTAFTTIWLQTTLVNRLMSGPVSRADTRTRVFILTAAFSLIGSVSGVMDWWQARAHADAWVWLPAALFVPGVAWFLAFAQAAQRQYASTTSELDELSIALDWEVARANAEEWQQRRALSRALHGPLQAALNAAALRLHAAVQQGAVDPGLVAALRDDIVSKLGSITAQTTTEEDFGLAFARIQGTWTGVCDVQFTVPQESLRVLGLDASARGAVLDIATEACSNAVRHGRATRIAITVRRTDIDCIELVIDDNGSLKELPVLPGLGTSLLDDVTLAWSLEPTLTGTRLVADLPLHVEPALQRS